MMMMVMPVMMVVMLMSDIDNHLGVCGGGKGAGQNDEEK
jgi:hypothetical protein